jgi:hypothetical protein
MGVFGKDTAMTPDEIDEAMVAALPAAVEVLMSEPPRIDHSQCDHPKTQAGRRKCRRAQRKSITQP